MVYGRWTNVAHVKSPCPSHGSGNKLPQCVKVFRCNISDIKILRFTQPTDAITFDRRNVSTWRIHMKVFIRCHNWSPRWIYMITTAPAPGTTARITRFARSLKHHAQMIRPFALRAVRRATDDKSATFSSFRQSKGGKAKRFRFCSHAPTPKIANGRFVPDFRIQ